MKKLSSLTVAAVMAISLLGVAPANASPDVTQPGAVAVSHLPKLPDDAPVETPPIPALPFADVNANVKADFEAQIESVKKVIREAGGGGIASISRTMLEPGAKAGKVGSKSGQASAEVTPMAGYQSYPTGCGLQVILFRNAQTSTYSNVQNSSLTSCNYTVGDISMQTQVDKFDTFWVPRRLLRGPPTGVRVCGRWPSRRHITARRGTKADSMPRPGARSGSTRPNTRHLRMTDGSS